jgi:hypothetical protein
MGLLSAQAFAAALGDLDRDAFAAFVADVLEARGETIERIGEGLLVTSSGGQGKGGYERVLVCDHPGRFRLRSPVLPDRADVLVSSRLDPDRSDTPTTDRDVTLLDARDLHGLLCYGLDRETANGIARTHLGRSLSASAASGEDQEATTRAWAEWVKRAGLTSALAGRIAGPWGRWGRWSESDEPSGDGRSSGGDQPSGGDSWGQQGRWRGSVAAAVILAAVVLITLVFGAGALGAPGAPGGIGALGGVGGGGDGDGDDARGPSGADEAGAAADSVASSAGELSVTPAPAAAAGPQLAATNESLGSLPPGLDESGIANADALARAHEAVVANRSYRWNVTYAERVDGRRSGTVRETVAFERPGVYTVNVRRRGDPTVEPVSFSSQPVYADGEQRYEPIRVTGGREDVQVTGLPIAEERPFGERAGTYVEWYLSVSRSAITDVVHRNGRTFYRVKTIGDPYPGAENARASALIDSRGMVHRLRSERDVPDSDVSVTLTFRYGDVGNTTVEPPAWYEPNGSEANAANGTNTTNATSEAGGTDGAGADDIGGTRPDRMPGATDEDG